MKTPTLILAALSLFSTHVHGHYSFAYLVVNGTFSFPWVYVRQTSGLAPTELPQWASGKPGAPLGPIYVPDQMPAIYRATPLVYQDILTPNFRCGRDGWMSSNTGTANVLAGDVVGFQVEMFFTSNPPMGVTVYSTVRHIGPGQVYLAKKPDGVKLNEWDGDGDWFKIDYSGPVTDESWKLLGANQYDFIIPKTTPPGEYLLRVEHLYPSTGNTSEFFVNCAQINIIGPGGGTPTGFARFPGTYQPDEAALSLPEGEEILNGSDPAAIRWKHGFSSYVPPGPPVWTG